MTTGLVAVDLGATSGRVIYAEVSKSGLRHEVVHRFPNGPVQQSDGLHWDVSELFRHITHGLASAARSGRQPVSIGVDSWAVDYGLLRSGKLLWEPFHYRDERTADGVKKIHAQRTHAELFGTNGLQFLPFNTIYQLATEQWSGPAGGADALLLVPDLIGWWLSGVAVTEATNASTTGLVGIATGTFDDELIRLSGATRELFAPLVEPGQAIGKVDARWVDGLDLDLVLVGSHDTASAVVGTPIEGSDCAYISCGTWGLVGLELEQPILTEAAREANFTNERGVDNRVRFLTNVMGLWILNESVKQWRSAGLSESVESLVAQAADYDGPISIIDVADPVFMSPGNMPERIAQWAEHNDVAMPDSPVAVVACIVHSLAEAFTRALRAASDIAGVAIRQINLTGGGSQNRLLCQALADRAGLPVIAGPAEATAVGNVLVQARAAGALSGDLDSLRGLLHSSNFTEVFEPRSVMSGGHHGG